MIKDRIVKAYNFAEKAHEGQERKFSGLPYFTHPKGVARILDELVNDENLIIAGFLHDVVADTDITIDEIRGLFGDIVADLVLEATSDSIEQKRLGKRMYLADKMCKMSSDALLLKLAARLQNILYLQGDVVPMKFITKYYKETRFLMLVLKEDYTLLGDKHNILIGKIDTILDFLQIRHKL
jgi:(p)ppGpp synthase/HD superfamily hydrolase